MLLLLMPFHQGSCVAQVVRIVPPDVEQVRHLVAHSLQLFFATRLCQRHVLFFRLDFNLEPQSFSKLSVQLVLRILGLKLSSV